MATDLMNAPPVEAPPFQPWRFTLEEYRRIRDSGVLDDGPRFEFLDGWIVPKMTQGTDHNMVLSILQEWLTRHLPSSWQVRGQMAVEVAGCEPEPDIAVVRSPLSRYRDHQPLGDEILLLVEVAETSLARDRRKALVYAAGGVPNYWIVNLPQQQVELYHNPLNDGSSYRDQHIAFPDEALDVTLDGETIFTIRVDEFLAGVE